MAGMAPKGCSWTIYAANFRCLLNPLGGAWDVDGEWAPQTYATPQSPTPPPLWGTVRWTWSDEDGRWIKYPVTTCGQCAELTHPMSPGEYDGQEVVLPCLSYPTMMFTPGGGSLSLRAGVPSDVKGWMLDVIFKRESQSVGTTLTLGIGGKLVKYEITSAYPGTVTCGRVSVDGGNTVNAYGWASLYGRDSTLGLDQGWTSARVRMESRENGQGWLTVRGLPDLTSQRVMDEYMLPLSPCDPESREITISADGPLGIAWVQLFAILSPVLTEKSPSIYRTTTQPFVSLCNHDPDTWNFNGSPCCMGALLSWSAPWFLQAVSANLRLRRTSANVWEAESGFNTYERGPGWAGRRVTYDARIETAGNVWNLTVTKRDTGEVVFEISKTNEDASPYMRAEQAAYFEDIDQRGRGVLKVSVNMYYGYNHSFYPDCTQFPGTPQSVTTQGCLYTQWVDAVTLTLNGGIFDGVTFAMPVVGALNGTSMDGIFCTARGNYKEFSDFAQHEGVSLTALVKASLGQAQQVSGQLVNAWMKRCSIMLKTVDQYGNTVYNGTATYLHAPLAREDCTAPFVLKPAGGMWNVGDSVMATPGLDLPETITLTCTLGEL